VCVFVCVCVLCVRVRVSVSVCLLCVCVRACVLVCVVTHDTFNSEQTGLGRAYGWEPMAPVVSLSLSLS
jgi:hypothetical protein